MSLAQIYIVRQYLKQPWEVRLENASPELLPSPTWSQPTPELPTELSKLVQKGTFVPLAG